MRIIQTQSEIYKFIYLPAKSQATTSKNGNKRQQKQSRCAFRKKTKAREKLKLEGGKRQKKAIFNREQIYV